MIGSTLYTTGICGVGVGMGVGVSVGLADVDIERVDINMGMAPSTDAGEMRDDRDAGRGCSIEERGATERGGEGVGRSNGLAECK